VFCILLALFTATFRGVQDAPEVEAEFQTTSSLVRRGKLAIGGTPEAEALSELVRRSELLGDPPPHGLRRGKTGALYAEGLGQALGGLPFYFVGRLAALALPQAEARHAEVGLEGRVRSELLPHVVVGWRNALLVALTALCIYSTARRLSVGRGGAWLTAVSFGCATYAWFFARTGLSDVQLTFLLFLAFHVIVRVRESFWRLVPPSGSELFGLGAVLSGAFLTRPSSLPVICALGVAALLVLRAGREQLLETGTERMRKRSEKLRWTTALVALGCSLGPLVLIAADVVRFGDPWVGLRALVPQEALADLVRDWRRELFAPVGGMLWLAPGVLLFPFGVARAWEDEERLWPWVWVGVLAALLVPVGGALSGEDGVAHAATYGPRHWLPLLPFTWLGVGLALEGDGAPLARRVAAGLLVVWGLVVALPGVLVEETTYRELARQARALEQRVEPEDAAWDWRFAGPWAHWRILRHRVAGRGERFAPQDVFFVETEMAREELALSVPGERDQGFRHLVWVDLEARLGLASWPLLVFVAATFVLGLGLALRGFEPGRP
jgi:hypothetical protein